MIPDQASFRGFRFPAEVILWAVRWDLLFPIRYRDGPVAKFENGRKMGRAGPPFTTAIRGQPSVKAEPIRPFLASLTDFATGPPCAPPGGQARSRGRDAPESLEGFGFCERPGLVPVPDFVRLVHQVPSDEEGARSKLHLHKLAAQDPVAQ